MVLSSVLLLKNHKVQDRKRGHIIGTSVINKGNGEINFNIMAQIKELLNTENSLHYFYI